MSIVNRIKDYFQGGALLGEPESTIVNTAIDLIDFTKCKPVIRHWGRVHLGEIYCGKHNIKLEVVDYWPKGIDRRPPGYPRVAQVLQYACPKTPEQRFGMDSIRYSELLDREMKSWRYIVYSITNKILDRIPNRYYVLHIYENRLYKKWMSLL